MRFALVALLVIGCKGDEPTARPATSPPPVTVATPDPWAVSAKPGEVKPAKPGTLRTSPVEATYGVILAEGVKLEGMTSFVKKKAPDFEIDSGPLARLDGEALDILVRDLVPAEATAVRKSPGMIVITGRGDDAMKLVREVADVTNQAARMARGWVVDLDTFTLVPAAKFAQHIPGERLDARKLVAVHSVTGDDSRFLDTGGLRRYGFPELYVPNASPSQTGQVTNMIFATAQHLLVGGDVDDQGQIAIDFTALGWDVEVIGKGTGKAIWRTRWTTIDGTEVLQLVPLHGEGTEGLTRMIEDCFGFVSSGVVSATDDDLELLVAANQARADLVKLRPTFANGVPPSQELAVKAKFSNEQGDVEWMWIDVVSFRGDTFEGVLNNQPQLVTTLRTGMTVSVALADVGDYIHAKPGTKPVGGYSVEIFAKRQRQ
jgi:uncharacterized protein YegJ (DUF2314 family)